MWGLWQPYFQARSVGQTTSLIVFYVAVNYLRLHRSRSWSHFIDPWQDFPKWGSRYGKVGQLERDVLPVTGPLRANFRQLLS